MAVVAAVFWLHGLSDVNQAPGASGLGPIQRAQATQHASATRTTLASIPPTPTVVLPPASGNGAAPSWRTVAALASISGDSGMSGRFLVRAGA
ncbi:MAG: hypothetical protein KGO05_16365, partial [Chloroflexota bacterium]|nr:hypothetical protein [Chloroflexota bacterium]